jgi:hypothetical protein
LIATAASVFPLGYAPVHYKIFATFFPSLTTTTIPNWSNSFAMLSLLPTIVALYFFSSAAVRGSPCVAFDVKWNLLAFGLDGKDWNAGTQDTWADGTSQ